MYADTIAHLKQRGVGRRTALLLMASHTTVPLENEWLEAFWCQECQETKWYHVHKLGERSYQLALAPQELWQQVQGVINAQGNPSVGEFTRRHARMLNFNGIKDYRHLG